MTLTNIFRLGLHNNARLTFAVQLQLQCFPRRKEVTRGLVTIEENMTMSDTFVMVAVVALRFTVSLL